MNVPLPASIPKSHSMATAARGAGIEREILFSGSGGQGIQLAAKALAAAAMCEAREVMVFGIYGGSMRGGNTDAAIVIGNGALLAPPVVDSAWAALVMHHQGWQSVRERLRPGALVLVDTSVFRGPLDGHAARVVELRATALATERGQPRTASMIALGAFAAATRIVTLESLLAAAEGLLPSYRAQHAPANAAALRFGYAQIAAPLVDAWTPGAMEAAA